MRALVPRPYTRDTDAGDVIVDPRGRAHRYDGLGFRAIGAAGQALPSPGAIAAERDRSAIVWGVDDVPEERPGLDAPGPERDHEHGR